METSSSPCFGKQLIAPIGSINIDNYNLLYYTLSLRGDIQMALNDRKLVEIILAIMKACVEADNFSVLQRDKNIDFELQYRLDRNRQKEILLELTTEDYFDSDENRNEPGSYLHEFSKTVTLEKYSTGKMSKSTFM
jgi:hypothetical protein